MDKSAIAASNITVLSFEPNRYDRAALENIFHDSRWPMHPGWKWQLKMTPTLRLVLAAIRIAQVPLVVCGCDVESGTWKQMLEAFPCIANPPLLIVTSRLADDRLWVEALNLGAYDVLAKPYDTTEVIRTFNCAWLRWQVKGGISPGPAPPARARAKAS